MKNSQDPEWNFGADFELEGGQPADLELAVFDEDQLGADKPLGRAALPLSDLLQRSADPNSGPVWVPLGGAKSGEVRDCRGHLSTSQYNASASFCSSNQDYVCICPSM